MNESTALSLIGLWAKLNFSHIRTLGETESHDTGGLWAKLKVI
jgi:hypothetical protein